MQVISKTYYFGLISQIWPISLAVLRTGVGEGFSSQSAYSYFQYKGMF